MPADCSTAVSTAMAADFRIAVGVTALAAGDFIL
jgi:hypothetical protein